MNVVSRNGNIFEDVAIKAPVRLASTLVNLTLSGEQTIDGVAAVDGDRVLVTAQTDERRNGIWQVSSGPWQRTADARNNTDFIDGTLVLVARGDRNAGELFQLQCTDGPITIDSSDLVFTPQSEVSDAQQAGSSSTSNTISVGAKSFATQPGRNWSVGEWVLIYETSNAANQMLAQIDSYSAGALEVTSVSTGGSGTHADWSIVLVNSPAAAGRVPPNGTGNVTGPGSSTAGHLPVFADATGKVLVDSGQAIGDLASRDTLLYGDAGTASIAEASLAPGSMPLPYCGPQPNDNLHLVNDGANPNRDIDITPGRCRDDVDGGNLHLVGTMAKRLDQAWAAGGVVGAPAGACDSGTKGASQTWHQFLIGKRNLTVTAFSRSSNVATITVAAHGGGVGGTVRTAGIGSGFDALAAITAVATNTISYANTGADVAITAAAAVVDIYDVLASQSYASPTMPAGWTVKQCLGSMLTDGSGNVVAVSQIGDEFLYKTPALDVPLTAVGTVSVLLPLLVPLGVRVLAIMNVGLGVAGSTGAALLLQSPDQTDVAPGDATSLAPLSTLAANLGFGGTYRLGGQARVWTDVNAQVRARCSNATTGIAISAAGYRDPRRRLF